MKVLVAIDSSNYADEVLEQLAIRTWPAGSEFLLITAVETCQNWELQDQFTHPCRIILEQRVDDFMRRVPQSKVSGQVLEGSAAKAIIRSAQEFAADLIVIGSHGDTGRRRATIGSVAASVVNQAECSVEVIKLRQATGRRTAAEAVA